MTWIDAHFAILHLAHSVDLARIVYFWKFENFGKKETKVDLVEAPPIRVVHVLIEVE